jgi:type IV secretion system protein VirB6
MGAIDAVQVPAGDTANAEAKARAMLIATLGSSSPAMAAGAMLLLYQMAMALFIGLGPLFILCLIFEQTRSLFQRWLMYGLGTLFSMAVLNFVVSLVLDLTLRVAEALWGAQIITRITGLGAEGFTSQAMQQGGIGLLMTVLIVSTPPMAAMFFNGTLGSFMHYTAFGGGTASRPGPQGQPPGAYGSAGAYGGNVSRRSGRTDSPPTTGGGSTLTPHPHPLGATSTAPSDTVKPYQGGTEVRA